MPAAAVDPSRVWALLNEAGEQGTSTMVSPGLGAGVAAEGTLPEEFVPEGGRAVGCRMRGLDGLLVFFLSPKLVDEIMSGPLAGQGIAAAVEPALSRAASILDAAAPRALRIEAARELDPNETIALASAAWAFNASPLFAGEEHEASIAVFLDEPSDRNAEEPEPEIHYERFDAGLSEIPDAPPAPLAGGSGPQSPGFGDMAGLGGMPCGKSLRLLHDVEMDVTVELGRTRMTVRGILGLTPGSVIELDRAAGAPVDLLVNGTLIGRGEVVVIDEEFGVRISEIVGRNEEHDRHTGTA